MTCELVIMPRWRDLTIGCNGCDLRWGGIKACHCAGCHRTFTNLRNFDKHRVRGKCAAPESVGLVDAGRKYPCFMTAGNGYFDDD